MDKELQSLAEAYQKILIKETADDEAQDRELHQQISSILNKNGMENTQDVADQIMAKVNAHVEKQLADLKSKHKI